MENENELTEYEKAYQQVLDYKGNFYIGGGDTDELEARFEEDLNKLIALVEKETVETLTS